MRSTSSSRSNSPPADKDPLVAVDLFGRDPADRVRPVVASVPLRVFISLPDRVIRPRHLATLALHQPPLIVPVSVSVERSGAIHDHTDRTGVAHAEIVLPAESQRSRKVSPGSRNKARSDEVGRNPDRRYRRRLVASRPGGPSALVLAERNTIATPSRLVNCRTGSRW